MLIAQTADFTLSGFVWSTARSQLSVTDHASRSASGARKRVVGVLLGQDNGKTINVANSFAVPFEEDERDPKTWFLDHDYIEGMNEMFKKVNGECRALDPGPMGLPGGRLGLLHAGTCSRRPERRLRYGEDFWDLARIFLLSDLRRAHLRTASVKCSGILKLAP